MLPPLFDVKRTPVNTHGLGSQPHLNHRADSPPEPTSTYVPHPHPLGQKSFNHLSIWAYLAIAFILLAVSTVFAYLIYTCYHSGKSRQRGTGGPWKRVPGIGTDGRAVRIGDKVVDVGEKVKLGGIRVGRAVRDLKGLGFGHDRKQSESETKMIRLPRPTASKTASSLSTTKAGSFDLDYNYVSSPPLVHAKEGPATCIPFHLPPPPPSPTPRYKRQMERQMSRGQYSPASPSPSARSILSPPRRNSNEEFDSNDIQFAPALNPFMTPPTGLLWNDPKLSPIHGSIITSSPAIGSGLSTPERPSFTGVASSRSPGTSGRSSKAPLSSSPSSSTTKPKYSGPERDRGAEWRT
ncbi:hypothetical protein M413DRAFT_26767 [Hebeloma cylindrosporum]|uniref:Uncharacterized protein n=1 Tax=Hebeloma cylindrosporum TaxID=76867 RepID=A0A0C3CGN4_HEBCY|nr:hypothetical protein M413DRAFT_26767 [Hebeloma cylindrosporum h7]